VVVAGGARRGEPQPRRTLLTPRVAVLALLALGILLSAALPLREYVQQRGEIAALEEKQAATRERIAALEAEKARLQDPAYLAAEARRRLHFVLPGETAYVVLAAKEPPPGQRTGTEDADAPWWSQVWGSVRAADATSPPGR
jgi:cell division protein FtsB